MMPRGRLTSQLSKTMGRCFTNRGQRNARQHKQHDEKRKHFTMEGDDHESAWGLECEVHILRKHSTALSGIEIRNDGNHQHYSHTDMPAPR